MVYRLCLCICVQFGSDSNDKLGYTHTIATKYLIAALYKLHSRNTAEWCFAGGQTDSTTVPFRDQIEFEFEDTFNIRTSSRALPLGILARGQARSVHLSQAHFLYSLDIVYLFCFFLLAYPLTGEINRHIRVLHRLIDPNSSSRPGLI